MSTHRHSLLRMLKFVWKWLRWPVALGIVAFLYLSHREQLDQFVSQKIHYGYLTAAALSLTFGVGLTFIRWYHLVRGQNLPFTIKDALRLSFIGYLFHYVAPGVVGGDLVRGLMMAREQHARRAVAVATILLDRILGMVALFLVGSFASLFNLHYLDQPEARLVIYGLWIGAASGLVGMGLMLHPSVPRWHWLRTLTKLPLVGHFIGEILDGVVLYQERRTVLVHAVLIGMAGHFGMLSSFYFCSRTFPGQIDFAPGYWSHLVLIPGAEIAAVLLPLPGGLGALEGAMQYMYVIAAFVSANTSPVLMSSDLAKNAMGAGLLTAMGYRVLTIILAAIGGGYYLASRKEIEEIVAEEEHRAEIEEGEKNDTTVNNTVVCTND